MIKDKHTCFHHLESTSAQPDATWHALYIERCNAGKTVDFARKCCRGRTKHGQCAILVRAMNIYRHMVDSDVTSREYTQVSKLYIYYDMCLKYVEIY